MGELSDQAKRIRQLKAVLIAAAKEAEKYAKDEWKKEYKIGQAEFGEYQKVKIKKAFDDAVTDWYDAYPPKYYRRRSSTSSCSGGLYNILSLYPDANGMYYDEDPNALYDEAGLHTDKAGNSLFEKVFIEGYHGGAEDGPGHPSPGTPYYRTGKNFSRWGYPAVQTESADSIFSAELSQLRTGDLENKFNEIMDKHHDITQEKIYKYVANIKRKIFGV